MCLSEQVLEQISRIVHFIESKGSVVTFSFLPYVPSYSKDPNVKTVYFPFPDKSAYITTLNNLFKDLGSRNPLGSCFSNRRVGLSATRKQVKPQDWAGYDSAAPNQTLAYANCFTYTPSVLANRSSFLLSHINSFLNVLS